MKKYPIAVIDSGVGGLACLGAIRKAMPSEDIIFLGDTANMPYGIKSVEALCACAKKMGDYLCSRNVKMIILACGTLSANCMDLFYREYPNVLVQGIIDAFFYEGDEIVLVDYKTDRAGYRDGAETLVSRYKVQLDYYGQALEKLTGKRVKEKIIYSFTLNREISVL